MARRYQSNRLVLFWKGLFWRKTLEDLMAELNAGQRREISGEELALARAYMKRRMPKGLRYPKTGEVYESVADYTVRYMTAWHAPYTGGGDAILPAGERIRMARVSDARPLGAYADPLRYDELHERIVPADTRAAPNYSNYYFWIPTVDLNRHFRWIETSGDPAAGNS